MSRWIMIAITLLGLIMAILTRSPGLLGLALVIMFVGVFGMVLSLASERISSNARSDTTMLSPEVLKAIRDRSNQSAQATVPGMSAATVQRNQAATECNPST